MKPGTLTIRMPCGVVVDEVVFNGVSYYREGHERIVTRVAPVKYHEKDFREVDELLAKGYRIIAACTEVGERHGFSIEGFARQYRDRWFNKKVRMKHRTE